LILSDAHQKTHFIISRMNPEVHTKKRKQNEKP
jgi:hypothetical protein